MIRPFLLRTLVACLVMIYAQSSGANPEEAERILADWIDEYPGLAAVVVRDGRTLYARGFGFANVKHKIAATPDTVFNVYSVAKMINGVALGRMIERDGLDSERTITEWLPSLPDHYREVTPKLLAQHLGGVGHYLSGDDWLEFAAMACKQPGDALPHFVDRPLITPAGHGFQYTTYGHVLLSATMDAAYPDEDYSELIERLIFRPAGMHSARLDSGDIPAGEKSVNYEKRFWGIRATEPIDASCKFGGGGFVASARDLARFGTAILDGRLVSRDMLEQISEPGMLADGTQTQYGFGMTAGVHDTGDRTLAFLSHSGGSPGGRGFVLLYPEIGTVVAMAGNYEGENFSAAARQLGILFGTGSD